MNRESILFELVVLIYMPDVVRAAVVICSWMEMQIMTGNCHYRIQLSKHFSQLRLRNSPGRLKPPYITLHELLADLVGMCILHALHKRSKRCVGRHSATVAGETITTYTTL